MLTFCTVVLNMGSQTRRAPENLLEMQFLGPFQTCWLGGFWAWGAVSFREQGLQGMLLPLRGAALPSPSQEGREAGEEGRSQTSGPECPQKELPCSSAASRELLDGFGAWEPPLPDFPRQDPWGPRQTRQHPTRGPRFPRPVWPQPLPESRHGIPL